MMTVYGIYRIKIAQKFTYLNITDEEYFQDEVNKDMQFTVLNDRAQGGSSIKDGEIELMVRNVTSFHSSTFLLVRKLRMRSKMRKNNPLFLISKLKACGLRRQ